MNSLGFIKHIFLIALFISTVSICAMSQEQVNLPPSELFRLTRVNEQFTDNIEVSIYEIKNISDDNLWILFEHDLTMTTEQLIRLRFKKNVYGGMSMFQWMMDDDVDWSRFVPDLYDTFFKILPPGQSFYICIYDNNDKNKIIGDIRILSNIEIKKTFNLLSKIPADKKTSYQPTCINIRESNILPSPPPSPIKHLIIPSINIPQKRIF